MKGHKLLKIKGGLSHLDKKKMSVKGLNSFQSKMADYRMEKQKHEYSKIVKAFP